MTVIPAIDLFAGPGGLAEGFSRFSDGRGSFDVRLSIEKDEVACRTLRLRAFVRAFRGRQLPDSYYKYIQGDEASRDALKRMPEWQVADSHIKQWTLGEKEAGARGYVSLETLHTTVHEALRGATEWVLLGGPPCQAYSLIGRARMTGIGSVIRNTVEKTKISRLMEERASTFADDHRHNLYREYLRVVAVHQPPVFVMENVKGILSSRIVREASDGTQLNELVFERIRQDLSDPWKALQHDVDHEKLEKLARSFQNIKRGYRLLSFGSDTSDLFKATSNKDFVIRAERFGVPQQRHRVIILGIRNDIQSCGRPLDEVLVQTTVRDVLFKMPKLRSALSKSKETMKVYGADSSANWCRALASEIEPSVKEIKDEALVEKIRAVTDRKDTRLKIGSAFEQTEDAFGDMPPYLRNWFEDKGLGGVIQHQSRSHMASDLARYLYLSASAKLARNVRSLTLKDWPKSLLPRHANIRHEGRKRIVEGFVDRFRVQTWDRPSSTITSHIHKDGHYFIHPDPKQCRSLTVREAARLQTFPDNYFFEGKQGQQFAQVGNAVPPLLAYFLAQRVSEVLIAEMERQECA